jgi:hypothetical protein
VAVVALVGLVGLVAVMAVMAVVTAIALVNLVNLVAPVGGGHDRRALWHQPAAETHRRGGVQQHRHPVDPYGVGRPVRQPAQAGARLRPAIDDLRAPADREEVRGGGHRRAVDPYTVRSAGRGG